MDTITVLIIISLVMVGANVFLQVHTGRRDSRMIRDLLNRTMAKDYGEFVRGEVAQNPVAKEDLLSPEERAFIEERAQGLPVA